MRRLVLGAWMAVGTLGLGSCALQGGCSGFDDTPIQVACGNIEAFASISGVFEKRCGTLDCHGSLSRPMRIYGRQGLRKPIVFGDKAYADLEKEVDAGQDQYFPGGDQPTTPSELLENWRAVCGLEPELTTLVVQGKEDPETLTLIRKMRLREKHKGGQIFAKGDPGDKCIIDWLTGTSSISDAGLPFDPVDCNIELAKP